MILQDKYNGTIFALISKIRSETYCFYCLPPVIEKLCSPQDIASKIAILLGNRDFARKIGKKGREFARTNFNWKKAALNLLQFYKRILMEHSNSG